MAFLDRSKSQERIAPLTMIHIRYSEIVCNVAEKDWRQASIEEALQIQYEKVRQLIRIYANGLKTNCDSGLYTLEHHL